MDLGDETQHPGHFTARQKALVGGQWSWSGCFGEDIALLLLSRYSSVYPLQCTEYAIAKI